MFAALAVFATSAFLASATNPCGTSYASVASCVSGAASPSQCCEILRSAVEACGGVEEAVINNFYQPASDTATAQDIIPALFECERYPLDVCRSQGTNPFVQAIISGVYTKQELNFTVFANPSDNIVYTFVDQVTGGNNTVVTKPASTPGGALEEAFAMANPVLYFIVDSVFVTSIPGPKNRVKVSIVVYVDIPAQTEAGIDAVVSVRAISAANQAVSFANMTAAVLQEPQFSSPEDAPFETFCPIAHELEQLCSGFKFEDPSSASYPFLISLTMDNPLLGLGKALVDTCGAGSPDTCAAAMMGTYRCLNAAGFVQNNATFNTGACWNWAGLAVEFCDNQDPSPAAHGVPADGVGLVTTLFETVKAAHNGGGGGGGGDDDDCDSPIPNVYGFRTEEGYYAPVTLQCVSNNATAAGGGDGCQVAGFVNGSPVYYYQPLMKPESMGTWNPKPSCRAYVNAGSPQP